MDAEFRNGKVLLPNGKELHDKGFGKMEENVLVLDPIEALFLLERGRIKILSDTRELNNKNFLKICCSSDPRFEVKYTVYKDLKLRGFHVRPGFEGSDFRVYEKSSAEKRKKIKWIVFCNSEDSPCNLDQLARAVKLAKNIRTTALWAVVDNDSDVTYYIINEMEKL